MFSCRSRFLQSVREVKYRASRYLTLFSCNKLTCLCKSETHVTNYCKYKLSRDREKNPNKTIAAPYSQGNELVFGQNCSYKFSLKR